ncbi:MAG TPA: hypothetical protein VGP07_17795 [Polyangia bacterium]
MAGVGRLADWIESSCLFGQDGKISKTEVVDELVGSGVIQPKGSQTSEEIAEEIVDEVFVELRRRQNLTEPGGPFSFPFDVESSVLRRRESDWTSSATYGFLLLATMGQLVDWLRTKSTTYDEIGHLFEDIVRLSTEGLFGLPSAVLLTSKKGADHLKRRVRKLLLPFNRGTLAEIAAAPRRVRDGGLDVVVRLWDHTRDRRPGNAHFLIQCAAGKDWEKKVNTPELANWQAWVDWRGPIYKGFAVPFLFSGDQRLHAVSRAGGWTLILDRIRLLYGLGTAGSMPSELTKTIREWCKRQLPALKKNGLAI